MNIFRCTIFMDYKVANNTYVEYQGGSDTGNFKVNIKMKYENV